MGFPAGTYLDIVTRTSNFRRSDENTTPKQ
jgi:hypothetical protein